MQRKVRIEDWVDSLGKDIQSRLGVTGGSQLCVATIPFSRETDPEPSPGIALMVVALGVSNLLPAAPLMWHHCKVYVLAI